MCPCVHVVDDDPVMRDAIVYLLGSLNYDVRAFDSPGAFFDVSDLDPCQGCIILDVRLPGETGLRMQERLAQQCPDLPIVFITAYAEVEMAVQAMKAGAIDFLSKPFRDQQLLDAVNDALLVSEARIARRSEINTARQAYSALSPPEREVMHYVAAGLMNKQIAAETGRSENTVKIHRGRMMHKMRARTVSELVRLADNLGLRSDRKPLHN